MVDPSLQYESFIDRMGHFKRIRILEDSYHNNGNLEDMMYFVKKVDKKVEIINEIEALTKRLENASIWQIESQTLTHPHAPNLASIIVTDEFVDIMEGLIHLLRIQEYSFGIFFN